LFSGMRRPLLTRQTFAATLWQSSSQTGEFGRHIELKVLRAEGPLHYLVNSSSDRLREAVNRGDGAARRWCVDQGIPLSDHDGPRPDDPTELRFTEETKGYLTLGDTDYDAGFREGRESGTFLMFHLTIEVDGIERFVSDPEREATAEGYIRCEATAEGYIRCEALGGQLPVEKGLFNLFVYEKDPSYGRMRYRLFFRGGNGRPLTLSGFKVIEDDPGSDLWTDTTTLFPRMLEGHVGPEEEEQVQIVASEIINSHLLDFFRQPTTFRTKGPTAAERALALTRFGKLFLVICGTSTPVVYSFRVHSELRQVSSLLKLANIWLIGKGEGK
jgi:hypothetical protein